MKPRKEQGPQDELPDGFKLLHGEDWATARAFVHDCMVFDVSNDLSATLEWDGTPENCAMVRVQMPRKTLELAIAGWAPDIRMPAREYFIYANRLFNADASVDTVMSVLRDASESRAMLRDHVERKAHAEDLAAEFELRARLCDEMLEHATADLRHVRGAIPAAAAIAARVMLNKDAGVQ